MDGRLEFFRWPGSPIAGSMQTPYNEVRRLFHSLGMSPSEIDKKLGLDEGTAKLIITSDWHDDKAFSARMVRHG